MSAFFITPPYDLTVPPPVAYSAFRNHSLITDDQSDPPNYEEAPPYTPAPPDPQQSSVIQYSIFKISRHTHVLEPSLGSAVKASYTLEAKAALSRKPDLTLLQTAIPSTDLTRPERTASVGSVTTDDSLSSSTPTSPGTGRRSSFTTKPVATASFDKSSTIPYFPRANITPSTPAPGMLMPGTDRIRLESRDMARWTFDLYGIPCRWAITDAPAAFTLSDQRSKGVLARMTFSAVGTSAAKGAEVGRFDVFPGELLSPAAARTSLSDEERAQRLKAVLEVLLCSYALAVSYHVDMGKKFRSNVSYSTYVRARDPLLAHGRRTSLGSYAMAWDNM